jgi:zinc-binding alcohol dehydrogenase/oxidoreductase
MKAVVLNKINEPLIFTEITIPKAQKGEVLLQIRAAALNHRDVYISQGLYPHINVPVILGSDASAVAVAVGEGVDNQIIDNKFIINPNNNWGNDENVQSAAYFVLGMPQNGTFAEYICVSQDRLFAQPAHLLDEEAAALPLAGLTAFRAVFTKGELKPKQKILITGIGGGVALLAMQLALAAGAEVFVTSGDEQKLQKAIEWGASGGANYKMVDYHKTLLEQAKNGFDLIIDSAGGDGFGRLIDMAKVGGRIVFYGGTLGTIKISPQKVFWKQLTICGTTMGSDAEFAKLIAFVEQYKIKPIVDKIFTFEQANEAFQYMHKAQQLGKIVLTP